MKSTHTSARSGSLSVRNLLYIAIAFQIVLAVALGLLGLRGMYSTLNGLNEVYNDRVIPLRDLKVISDEYAVAIVDATQKVRDGTIQADTAAATMARARSLIDDKWKAYTASPHLSEAERALIAKAEPTMEKGNALVDLMVERLKLNALFEIHGIAEQTLYPTLDPITEVLRQLIETQLEQARSDYEAEQANFHDALTLMILMIVAAATLSGIGGVIFARNFLMRPLDDARRFANDIASGNLGSRIEVQRDDEIGSLTAALQTMQLELRNMVQLIQNNAEQIASASENLASSTGTISAATVQQSSAAESIAAAIDQMSGSIGQVSNFTAEAKDIATDSGAASRTGAEVIRRVVGDIERIADSVNQASAAVRDLGQHSQAIASVVTVIKEVADQTNLLALNAAIEAARAGEQGRGFAVVADEVRKLAERTAASTQDIARIVGQITAGTDSAVKAMDTQVRSVEASVALAGEAGEAIARINAASEKVVATVSDVSSALQEQSQTSSDIARGIAEIADMSGRNSTSARDVDKATRQLAALSAQLRETVRRFRLQG